MTAAVEPSPDAPAPGKALVHRASITEKIQYAQHLAQSGLLPEAYRRNPANVLYATEYGDMLDLAPMAAITGIHIIEGRPSASAALISALVRRAGHRCRIGYTPGPDGRSGWQGVGWCEIVRKDDPDYTYRVEWTIDRAKTALLCEVRDGKPWSRSKNGKPQSWEKYPQNMMKWRALTECARDACEEALMGMHYTAEELGQEVDEDGNPVRVQATAEPVNVTPIGDLDWPAEVAAAEKAQDRDKLAELWKLAKVVQPLNEGLHQEIADAGQRVKAALEEQATGVVDAEIVDEPAAPAVGDSLARTAAAIVDSLMVLSLPEHVAQVIDTDIEDQPVAGVDVSGLLDDEDREVLAVPEGALTLAGLAGIVAGYVGRHNRSPREATLPITTNAREDQDHRWDAAGTNGYEL